MTSGKDDDRGSGGLPDEVFRQMRDGHDKFMREIERQGDDALNRNSANIFVSFKDFVDLNLNALFHAFRSLPENLVELRKKMHEEQRARQQQEQECIWRWTGLDDTSPDHIAMLTSRASQQINWYAASTVAHHFKRAIDLNKHVAKDEIEKLYMDAWQADPFLDAHSTPMLSPCGASEYMRENGNNGYNMVATGNARFWRWPQDHRWLSPAWFKGDMYSPVNLEYDIGGTDWKAAFEDLICASLGKDFPKRTQDREQSRQAIGIMWTLDLYRCGILPPSPRASRVAPSSEMSSGIRDSLDGPWTAVMQQLTDDLAATAEGWVAGCEDGESRDGFETELDVYEELERLVRNTRLEQEAKALGVDLEDESPAETRKTMPPQHSPPPAFSSIAESQPPPRVDVLSSLTTTTTTRMPDGTITTKIVLRQKFADGREETQEKVHTYQESANQRQTEAEAVTEREAKPEKNGWFWK